MHLANMLQSRCKAARPARVGLTEPCKFAKMYLAQAKCTSGVYPTETGETCRDPLPESWRTADSSEEQFSAAKPVTEDMRMDSLSLPLAQNVKLEVEARSSTALRWNDAGGGEAQLGVRVQRELEGTLAPAARRPRIVGHQTSRYEGRLHEKCS